MGIGIQTKLITQNGQVGYVDVIIENLGGGVVEVSVEIRKYQGQANDKIRLEWFMEVWQNYSMGGGRLWGPVYGYTTASSPSIRTWTLANTEGDCYAMITCTNDSYIFFSPTIDL